MNPQDAIDLSREAIKTCMLVGGPILVISLLIGLLVGVFQAMTQVQDQTVSFVPKILLLIVAIGACLPWLTDQMMDFAKYAFEKPYGQTSIVMPGESFKTATLDSEHLQVAETPAVKTAALTVPAPRTVPQPGPTKPEVLSTARPASESNPPAATLEDDVELKSPFILPHYRFLRAPKTDIEG